MDGGANWSNVGLGGQFFYESLAIDLQNPGTVYAAGFSARTPPIGTGDPGPYFVFKTTDVGSDWIDPQDSNIVYVSVGRGIFGSTDGGATWSDANFGPPLFNVRNLIIDPENPGNVYAGNTDGVYVLTLAP